MEHVERQLLRGFPVGADPHDQSEDQAMRALIERVQRELIARGDGLYERHPRLLRFGGRRLGVKDVTQRGRRLRTALLLDILRLQHSHERIFCIS